MTFARVQAAEKIRDEEIVITEQQRILVRSSGTMLYYVQLYQRHCYLSW
jgi:hypothetical protein